MNLAIDVGNTETAIGLFEDGALRDHWGVSSDPTRTSDEFALLLRELLLASGHDPRGVHRAVIGSVVPPITDALRRTMTRLQVPCTVVVEPDSPLPIRLDVEEPRTVGADRIVNTLAASRLYQRDTIAVDLGTATTFDCITADGIFIGGVIAPGVPAGQEWLVRRTAKLPRVELVPPERVIGRRTESCLQSGILYSAVDAVDGIVRRIKREWERPDAFVVATGGFSSVIAPYCDSIDHIEPFLTLYGLEMAGAHIEKHSGGAETAR
ncbi:MAG: type III pantothenate kinase [Gemmatimonadetes bacterium]|nr:type III pantothenate kinase [Gemmatimonadota bacterium]